MRSFELDKEEEKLVADCLKAVVEGPYFAECEYEALLGGTKETVIEIKENWPEIQKIEADQDEILSIVICCLFNLFQGPHGEDERLKEDFSATSDEDIERIGENVQSIVDKLRSVREESVMSPRLSP